MAALGPDLYETLQIRYPRSPTRALAPESPPAASRWALGTAVGMGVVMVLVLGAALAALITLRPQSPSESPAAAQRRKEQLGRWLQGLSLGWLHHRGKIYYFSGEKKPWGEAEAACRFTHSHLASITSAEEQDYLAREARGGSYWIGLVATGSGGSWRWVDGAAYSQAQSFWAPGQPDSQDHGQWGQEGCAQIHPVGNGLWNDHNCNFTFPWICKRDLSRP
ncbi:C-type lectin domain family 4 member F-like isoform X2 [Calonectris borealis]|uniref:C-type lectin domain family 4 member F-like isoform X2 n=1 Tax=Calonectris borealis TaxID=1323832 RepID=UPI003F4B6E2D